MTRVFVLGIDGGTFDLIRPWVKQGKLPTFKKLIKGGVSGNLYSTIPPLTGPAWISMITGKNPGKHGCFDFMKWKKGSYEREPIDPVSLRDKTLWNIISGAGKRMCAINVPVTYPPQKVNGYLVAGLLTPSLKAELTYPSGFKKELLARVPGYRITTGMSFQPGKEKQLIEELYEITRQRTKLIKYMYKKEEFDFFMAVYGSPDIFTHYFWHHMDEKHPLHNPEKAKEFGNALLDYYIFLDKQIKMLMDMMRKDTLLIMVSDHGLGPYEKGVYINSWLMKKGYLKLKSEASTKLKYGLHMTGINLDNIYRFIQKLGLLNTTLLSKIGLNISMDKRSESIRKKVFRLFPIFLNFNDVDWKKTKAYSIGGYGQIYINLKGREPQGIVSKKDYNKVRDRLIRDLKKIVDPETHKPIDIKVLKKEGIYKGPYLKNAPDLFFIMKNFRYIAARYFEFGSPHLFGKPHRNLAGCHRLNGVFLAYGKEVQKGKIRNASITDIAPTVLHALGVDVPKDMDGMVLRDVYKKNSGLWKQKVAYAKGAKEKQKIVSVMDKIKL